jgi:hypothetical protein
MDRDKDSPDKLDDFERDLKWERRVVAFYDILGWRNHIRDAGNDPKKVGELRRIILLHSRLVRLPVEEPAKVSTFSDNIVISIRPTKFVPYFLRALALFQLMTANRGFLLRGGVAVGDVIHDDEVVFGPALVQAYDLESRIAKFPRIVLQKELFEFGEFKGFHAHEDGLYFLDPFTVDTVRYFLHEDDQKGPRNPKHREYGLPAHGKSLKDIPPDYFLRDILEQLKKRIRSPLNDEDWEKAAWLFDRIASRLGAPRAASYPRIRPEG